MGPYPVSCNALSTLNMYDPTKEFPALFPEEQPTELLTLRYPMEIMAHRSNVIPDSHWLPRFLRTYNQFNAHITQKVNPDLETGRVVPYSSSNAIGMFM